MRLATLHPRVPVQQVLENTEFDLILPKDVLATELPKCEELALLKEIDPDGIYIPRN
jgi:glutaconate CoA-transferase subunit B